MNRPVITGIGAVAAIGIGDTFAQALADGRSGIGDLVSFDASDTNRERAGEIQGFTAEPYLRSPKNYLDRNSALAFAACELAIRQSGALLPDLPRRYGLAFGSMAGNMESLTAFHAKVREKGPKLAPPFLFPHTYYNTSAGLLSIEYGLNGPHHQFCSGGAAGLEAVTCAARAVETGRASLMLAGGGEAFNESIFRVACARGWLSPGGSGEESCRPFADNRNGTILGEGAAFVVVESPESAASRRAAPLAVIESAGLGATAREAMGKALAGAPAIDAIFAAAGGYPREDEEEAQAILALPGGNCIPVVALKGLTGETLGAAGALNLAAAAICMSHGLIPPTPAADGSAFGLRLSREAQKRPVQRVLVNAGSPGAGHWVSLVISRP